MDLTPDKKPFVGNMLLIDSTSPVQHLARLAKELGQRRFSAPAYTTRQIRRIIYG